MPAYKQSDMIVAQRVTDGKIINVHFSNLELHSAGAFSNVYSLTSRGRAKDADILIPRDIAIKKTWRVHNNNDAFDIDSLPEIKILKLLQRLNHKNVVKLLYDYANDYSDRTCFALVFEFLPDTLYSFMKTNRGSLELIEIKMFTWQMFRGQAHLAKAGIVHRDIKPQNLLVDAQTGLLKISDFGSAVLYKKDVRQQCYHVTRYYRPPELLLEAKTYGTEIDVWSCGCVFGEMLAGKVLLQGRNSEHQLDLVIEHFGVPSREEAAAMRCPVRTYTKVTQNNSAPSGNYPKLNKLIPDSQPKDAIALLARVLVYKPQESDPFFDDIFAPEAMRRGKKIECLKIHDLAAVKHGDGDFTAESGSFSEPERRE